MNNDLQEQINGLQQQLDLLKRASSIPYDVESAFRERLNAPNITRGIVAPLSRPLKVGDIYVNTVLAKVYIAGGITSTSDWLILN